MAIELRLKTNWKRAHRIYLISYVARDSRLCNRRLHYILAHVGKFGLRTVCEVAQIIKVKKENNKRQCAKVRPNARKSY